MASTSGPVRQLVRNDTTSLDPVGVCLALEGRLPSADSREALSNALRQASEGGRCSSGGGDGGRQPQQQQQPQQQLRAGDDAGGPKCLSSQAHQLPADLLTAFQAGAALEPAAGQQPPGAADVSSGRPAVAGGGGPTCRSGGSSAGGAAGSSARCCNGLGPSRSGSGGGGGGTAASPPQHRPPGSALVTAAIERTSTATLDANGGVDHGAGVHDPSCTCPPYAVKSTCGKRQNMEDTYALCPNICELPMSPLAHDYADKLPHRIAVQFEADCQQAVAAASPPPQQAAPAAPAPQQPQQQAQPQPAAQQLQAGPGGQQLQQQQARPPPGPPQQQQQQPPHTAAAQAALCGAAAAAAAAGAPQAAAEPSEPSAAAFAGAAALPGQLAGGPPDAENSVASVASSSDSGCSVEKLHFFGVYDGHGGIEASQHCAQRLHYHLSKAVSEMASLWLESCAGDEAAAGSWNPEVRYVPLDTARVGTAGSGECSLAATATAEDAAGSGGSSSTGAGAPVGSPPAGAAAAAPELGRCTSSNSGGSGQDLELDSNEGSSGDSSEAAATSFSGMMEEVLRDAFLKTDQEFSDSGLQAGLVGSTAVVALVGTHRVWIANCGDSRAVLSRAGRAIQVTDDHKPEREDEAARVEKAGGQVLYWNGHRVMGVLAMSRAIGDHCLRPYVIPEPEISVFARHTRDEILLLASDGLWDVLSNQEATDLALRSIKRAREKGASRKAAARVAATVLTKAAVDRGSRDNITVVIIDLYPPAAGGRGCERAAPCCEPARGGGASAGGPASPECSAGGDAGGDAATPQQRPGHGAAAQPALQPAAEPAGGSLQGRPGSGGSSSGRSRPPSSSGRCGGAASNPFAAAAASPFSTAATGSSELPLPSGASASGAAAGDGAAPAGAGGERSARASTASAGGGGRLRSSSAGVSGGSSSSGSVFATAALPTAVCGAAGAASGCSAGSGSGHSGLAGQLDSIDLSGMPLGGPATPRGHGGRCSGSRPGHEALPSIESMADASSAADGSTCSSQLEEQPTIVDPPPALAGLHRQASSPFSACQGPAFADGDGGC